MGTRLMPLTKEIPKPLLEINGVTLLERMIKNCINAGITDFILIVGYNKEKVYDIAPKLEEKFDISIKIIENSEYDVTNTSVSTYLASSYIENCEPNKVIDGYSRKLGDDMHAWVSNGISSSGESLTMKWDESKTITELRYTFHSDFSYPIRVTMSPPRQKQQRIGVPLELVKDYDVIFKNKGEVVKTIEVTNNHQRHNVLKFEPITCDSVELLVKSTNGANEVTVFEVRAY
jgi:hypothetical protein